MKGKSFSHDLERSYYQDRWPAAAQPYLHLEPYIRCWADPEDVFQGKRVLDIGAGGCTYTRLIADRFAPKMIVACELFPEHMRSASAANQNARLSFVSGDVFHLPFQSGSFDTVFASLVLHQIPDLDRIIREIRRVLTPNGRYVGIEPNPYYPVHLYRYFFGKHSRNQYLLNRTHLSAFKRAGFDLSVRYFYARISWFRNRFFGNLMGIVANRV